jgi:hypothetical protein
MLLVHPKKMVNITNFNDVKYFLSLTILILLLIYLDIILTHLYIN